MAYEVTKLVHGRPYRYRVQSERDPATGRFRNRWTYLGRVDARAAATPPRRRPNSRTALLDALARLLEGSDPDGVTAARISAEAGVAHGTFYRYFRNKQAAIFALLERRRDERVHTLDPAVMPAGAEAARAAIRAWADELLHSKALFPGLIHAVHVLATRDAEITAYRREQRALFVARLIAYLEMLDARGWIAAPAADIATVLTTLMEGRFREALAGTPNDAARTAATVDAIERIVFGRV